MTAPLVACILFRAMEPEASTTKTMRDPVFRAIFLLRTLLCSMKTPRPSFLVLIAHRRQLR